MASIFWRALSQKNDRSAFRFLQRYHGGTVEHLQRVIPIDADLPDSRARPDEQGARLLAALVNLGDNFVRLQDQHGRQESSVGLSFLRLQGGAHQVPEPGVA